MHTFETLGSDSHVVGELLVWSLERAKIDSVLFGLES